jgi:hypothetical protein
MTHTFQELKAITDRIAELMADGNYSAVERVRKLPDERAGVVGQFRISKSGYSDRMTDDEQKLAQRAFNEMKRIERERGEQERIIGLRKFSAELESLRAVLPAIAAKVSIAAGERARQLAEEAA